MLSEKRFFVIAGEASGDLHGAALIRAIRERIPTAQFQGMGGNHMKGAGMELVRTYRSMNVMGFVEVAQKARHIWQVMRLIKRKIREYQPDAVILIDFPGFNMRIAKWAKKQGFPVVYYILPQVWAWHSSRVKQVKQWVDLPLAILPFEPEFYAQYGVQVDYVGHPLLEYIKWWKQKAPSPARRQLLLLMPGSRPQEVRHVLPTVLQGTQRWHGKIKTVIVQSEGVPKEIYRSYLKDYPQIELFIGHPYEVMSRARAAVITSGTATLEAALWNVPQVVVYRGNWWSYQLARRLIKVPFISLVNLIVGRKVVEELIQSQMTPMNVERVLCKIFDSDTAISIQSGYRMLEQRLQHLSASKRAARAIEQTFASF